MRDHIARSPPESVAKSAESGLALGRALFVGELLQFLFVGPTRRREGDPKRLPRNPSDREGLEVHGDGPDDRVVEAQLTGGERGGLVAGPQVAKLRALA